LWGLSAALIVVGGPEISFAHPSHHHVPPSSPNQSRSVMPPSELGPGVTLVSSEGDFLAPQFSPDGSKLLVTGSKMRGLAEIAVASGEVIWLLDEARVGAHSRYLRDGRIAFRARRLGKMRDLIIGPKGAISELHLAVARSAMKVFAKEDQIYLRTQSGTIQVSSGDRFFSPILSPDKSKIVFTGLATGVHLYDIKTRKHLRIGVGTEPSWSPDSTRIAFERTEDDGHHIVGSEIWLWSEASGAHPITKTERMIERRPSWNPTGTKLAFDDDAGAIYILSLPKQP